MAFSERSKRNLAECRPELVKLFTRVNEIVPCEIIEGKRDKDEQDALFDKKLTKVKWPNSKHNKEPLSWAADVCPLPIDWNNKEKFILFAGVVLGVAAEMGIKCRWGADWNRNFDLRDETFLDMPHFELIE